MIIELLLDVVYVLVSLLTAPIDIPSMPDEVQAVISGTLEYFEMGLGIAANYFDLGYLMILFGLVLAVDAGMLLYKLVMWFLRKIPMLGIK